MVHGPLHADDDEGRKEAHLVSGLMHIQAHGIEGTPHVQPIGWSDYPFIAKSKHLSAGNEIRPGFRGTAELNIGLTNIPGVLIRQCLRNDVIEKNVGVLSLPEESEPLRRLYRHVKPEPAQ